MNENILTDPLIKPWEKTYFKYMLEDQRYVRYGRRSGKHYPIPDSSVRSKRAYQAWYDEFDLYDQESSYSMIDFLSELYASISDKEVLSFLDNYKSTTKTDDERLLEEL